MRGVNINDLPERYKRQAMRQIGDNHTGATSERKRDIGDELSREEEVAGFDGSHGFAGPVRVTYRDYRKRLIDSDNNWTKYGTDALVSAGVLKDDTPKEIPERPRCEQRLSEEEKLVIIVEAI